MKVRQLQGMILLGNVVALIVYTIVIYNSRSPSQPFYFAEALAAIRWSFIHMWICFAVAIGLASLQRVEAGKAWLLSGFVVIVIGASVCFG